MTVLWGDTGKIAYGTNKKYTINVQLIETLVSSNNTLPTTNPASGQVSFTLNSSNEPIITPPALSFSMMPAIYVSGQNSTGASVTVYYEIDKNGTSIQSGSSAVANGNYWTLTYATDTSAKDGDVYSVKLYASATGVIYNYQAIAVYPVRVSLSKTGNILKNVSVTLASPNFTATGVSQSNNINSTLFMIGTDNSLNPSTYLPINTSGTFTYPVLISNANSVYNTFTSNFGEQAFKAQINSNTTKYPYYNSVYYPTSISFREVLR